VQVHLTTSRPVRRALALTACLGLALSACSSNGSDGSAPSPSAKPSPTSTVKVPAGVKLTAQGSKLSFGDTASVIFEPSKQNGTALQLTVKGAQQGSINDFKGFILDDKYKQDASYYYVDVTVKNVGEGDVGGVPVPLWGVSGDNVLLPAVNFTTSFPSCPSKPLPSKFAAGASFSTCLVYLSPNHGALDAVSYRPDQAFNPITWTGTVATPKATPTKSPRKNKKKHG
jgi:hypothetical protein